MKVEGFKDLVRNWWGGECSGSFSHILAVKLKALKQDLKYGIGRASIMFPKNTRGFDAIRWWDAKERKCLLPWRNVRLEGGWWMILKKWADLVEISMRQKSKELWLKEGDKNTSFFPQNGQYLKKDEFFRRVNVERCTVFRGG